ncbi:hypothetical protein ACWA2C_28085 [Priestia megaterium]
MKKEHGKISTENWSLISNPRVFDVEIYIQDKGGKNRDPKEFFLTLEYDEVKAWADFFNDQVADLQKKGKLE